jgi:hypothetical protein
MMVVRPSLKTMLVLVVLLLSCWLQGCSAGAPAATATPSSAATVAATRTLGLPADCAPLLRYQSGDRYGSPCVYAVCEDGRVVREGGACPPGVVVPERLSADQLAGIEERVTASDFLALETYYRAPDGCWQHWVWRVTVWRDGQSKEIVIESQAKIPDGLRALMIHLGELFWPTPATPPAQ